MSTTYFDSRIFGAPFGSTEIQEIFSDQGYLDRLLRFELALACVEERLDVIPAGTAEQIAAALKDFQPDLDGLAAGVARDGIPVPAILQQLRGRIGPPGKSYLHWGATSQDAMDTALVLQMQNAILWMESHLKTLIRNLAELAGSHRATLMAARTHGQQALPIPFGFKVAGWIAPLLRHRKRLQELSSRLLVLQFGGAVGTLAALGSRGPVVQEALAKELGLGLSLMPWHTQRDGISEFAGWLSLVSGSLGKIGQDVILMCQDEVMEIKETGDPERGGSSTMPQKHNPVISEILVAGARANAALLGGVHQALVQEHERGTHGWQMEWMQLPQMVFLTAEGLARAVFLSQNMAVDAQKMAQHVKQSRGRLMAEALRFALAGHLDPVIAAKMVRAACARSAAEDRHVVDILKDWTAAPLEWDSFRDERGYFGAAEEFITRILARAEGD